MRKMWKYVVFVILIVAISIGSYFLYTFKFKEYDVADSKVQEIINEQTFTVDLPNGEKMVVDEKGNIITDDSQASKTTTEQSAISSSVKAVPNKTASNEMTANKTTRATTEQKPTVESILEKYNPTFASLETQASDKLNALIGLAMNEYATKSANGEDIEYGYFYNKYVGAATNLEATTDAVFYSLLKVVEADLQANGYEKSNAQTLQQQYESAKEARRNSLLQKITGAL